MAISRVSMALKRCRTERRSIAFAPPASQALRHGRFSSTAQAAVPTATSDFVAGLARSTANLNKGFHAEDLMIVHAPTAKRAGPFRPGLRPPSCRRKTNVDLSVFMMSMPSPSACQTNRQPGDERRAAADGRNLIAHGAVVRRTCAVARGLADLVPGVAIGTPGHGGGGHRNRQRSSPSDAPP